jgi:hypothetical protein
MTYEPDRQLSDARALSAQWGRLARRSAAQGHGWLAAHAQVAADVEALRGLLVQRVVPAAADPEERYAEAAAVLSDALARAALHPEPAADAKQAVLRMRDGLRAAFDDTLRADVEEVLGAVDHLAGLDPQGPPDITEALNVTTDDPQVRRLVAAYVQHLDEMAERVGDTSRATVALRLAVAREPVSRARDPLAVRAVLRATLPAAERERLEQRWAQPYSGGS